MEYITFVENNSNHNSNHNETKVFVTYLQYTGNESELQKLEDYMNGGCSNFQMILSIKFSEYEVNHMCSLSYGNKKVNGLFKFPLEDDASNENIAQKLDTLFYGCKISNYFK